MISQMLFQGTKINLNANDTAILYSSENICDIKDHLNVDLWSISLWMEENKLYTLNAKKTKVTLSCSQPKLDQSQDLKISLNDVHLENVNECKYLGVIVDKLWAGNHTSIKFVRMFVNTLVYFIVSGSNHQQIN